MLGTAPGTRRRSRRRDTGAQCGEPLPLGEAAPEAGELRLWNTHSLSRERAAICGSFVL